MGGGRGVSDAYLILDVYDEGECSICRFAIDIIIPCILSKDLTEFGDFR